MNQLTDSELQLLKNANSQLEWDNIVDKIVADRNGQYPSNWAEKVLFGMLTPKYLLKSEAKNA